MKNPVSLTLLRLATLLPAAGLLSSAATAQNFTVPIFSDNFLTEIMPTGETTNLNTNIGLEGGRQGGGLVAQINPAGFGYTVYGQTGFSTGNGWDLRAQENWPPSGPIDTHTLRLRNDQVNWSTVSPNLGFVNNGTPFQIENRTYRIQVQVTHAHPDPGQINDRWAGISFGEQPVVRFPLFEFNGGAVVFASGDVQVFSHGEVVGTGSAPLSPNGAYDLDLRVSEGLGRLLVNGELIVSDLDMSEVNPAWIGLTGFSANDPEIFTSAQFRFDNLVVSIPGDAAGYDAWVVETWGEPEEGVTGRMNDPDGDGLVNLLEYALARNPLQPDRSEVVTLSMPAETGVGSSLTYRQRINLEDAVVFPQRSRDLIDWQPAFANEVDTYFEMQTIATDPDGLWEERIATDRDDTTPEARFFYRLRVKTVEP